MIPDTLLKITWKLLKNKPQKQKEVPINGILILKI